MENLHEMAVRLTKTPYGLKCRNACNCVANDWRSSTGECLIHTLTHVDNADDQIAKLRQWAAENPPKPVRTVRDVFFERNPEAPKTSQGCPRILPCDVGLLSNCSDKFDKCSFECWNRPAPEGVRRG